MRIAVCEDEREVREMLAEKVRELYPGAELSLYGSGEELLRSDSRPDILLLDIQLPGKNGMETAAEFRRDNKNAVLIFVTALEEYVFQAFDVGAFHYLVKPIDDGKFAGVLRNAVKQLEDRKNEMSAESRREAPGLMITAGGKHITVRLEDIVYAEVFDRKVIIHTLDADIEYYGKLKELEKRAGDEFYRPHRAYLVNFNFIRKYDAMTIWLERGQALMAKQNYREFVKSYLRYNQRKGMSSGLQQKNAVPQQKGSAPGTGCRKISQE
ncbi:MAG: LytTR family DNA-binding domain-containing protein [Lachnospiraceae bacterium]|nr:LytTR family DNA-binding domain-containing protein [Lachnospiraceae bacterium]